MIQQTATRPVLTLMCALLLTGSIPNVAAESVRGTVISITDGDTVIVAHDGIPEKVRLVDVDSPEKSQPFGRAAKKFLSELIYMHEVTVDRTGKDRYGRTLATVVLDNGTNVNQEILRAGYAWVYRGRAKNPALKIMENEAHNSKKGLWADANAIAPWHYRHAQKGLTSRRNPTNVANPSGLINELLQEPSTSKGTKNDSN